jgi:predicted TIM-barrel enzyme
MLHLGGNTRAERLDRVKYETQAYVEGGIDGVIVENYFGDYDDVAAALDWLDDNRPANTIIGLNTLDNDALAFELAASHPIDFVQLDGVAGHLSPNDDPDFAQQLAVWRASSLVFGGVRFKYQPVLSGNDEATDVAIGATRCDALVVTASKTGEETDVAKVLRFREVVGKDYPLLIGAGLTAENAATGLAVADGAIVGSYLKDTHEAKGIVSPANVQKLMSAVNLLR